jgi:hypothetical protein
MDYRSVICPRCGRTLRPASEMTVECLTVPVYTCPECLIRGTLFGRFTKLPLTFARLHDGSLVDPTDGQTELRP